MKLACCLVLIVASLTLADVKIVRVPDGGIQPQAAMDAKGVIHLVYYKGDEKAGNLFYTTSDDGALTFDEAKRVNSVPDNAIAIGAIRGAHLALGKGGRVHVAWMGSHRAKPKAPGEATPMLYTRLGDDGQFEPQRNVIAQHVGMDGGGSVAADDAGNVYVAWHAPPQKDGPEASRQLWIAKSADDGKTFVAEVPASESGAGACACCGARIAAGPKGLMMAAYRRAQDTTDRGTSLVVSQDGGKTFNVAQIDLMKSGKCIMSSYAIVPDPRGYALLFENEGELFRRPINAAGVPYGETDKIGRGKHATAAMNGDRDVVTAWAVGASWGKGGMLAWSLTRNGTPGPTNETTVSLPTWSMPAVIALTDGNFVILY